MNVIIEAGIKASPMENINDETIPSAVLCRLIVLLSLMESKFLMSPKKSLFNFQLVQSANSRDYSPKWTLKKTL